MNNLIPLVRRELKEHRAIFFAPAAFLGVALLSVAVGLIHSGQFLGSQVDLSELKSFDSIEMTSALGAVVHVVWVMFAIVGWILGAFYLLDCLYADRKDRSVLFWKSLPISDVETVASKALTGLVAIPAVMLGFAIMAILALIPLGSVTVALMGGSPWQLIIAPFPYFSGLASIISNSLMFALWFLPLAAYLMLCSAYARRAPFLYAILIPAGIALIEQLIFTTGHFGEMLGTYFGTYFETIENTGTGFNFQVHKDEISIDGDSLHSLNPWAALRQPLLYVGVAVGLAMLALTVRLRRVRIDAS